MLEIIEAGGWIMWPIILCSVIGVSIIFERLWTLQPKRVLPAHLRAQIWSWLSKNELTEENLDALRKGSPLGCMLAAGLENRHRDRMLMKESIEDTGRHVVHELERYLNTLGTIASISPLLGLLGTVIGIMSAFGALGARAGGDPTMMAAGVAQALVTTAAGLAVAIPALIAYRYLRGRIEYLVVMMEQEAIKLVDTISERRDDELQDEAA
ncbi:MAG TPA: MotA/TolQ/ExbB proton channel family protein [Gammaproteobacteria bacterium]|nr:MotA/TolQ/ExbB proton channel family protein [Gammaproteobacteria bacterium]